MRGRNSGELAADLRNLGVRPGQHLLVHCSLRSIGPVDDGPGTVFEALRQVIGEATIVVPAFTPHNSLSSAEFRAATSGLTRASRERYEAGMPGFDPASTPSEGMGKLAEYVRTRPDAVRTGHPQTSFAAVGADAAECGRDHALNGRFGESSPLGWLHRHAASVLLLGVGYEAFSAFHLAEYLVSGRPARRAYYCFVTTGGERGVRELWDVDLDDSDFAALGKRMDNQPFVTKGRIGDANCRLVPIRSAVEFALGDRAFRSRRTTAPAGVAAPPKWPETAAPPTARGGPRLPNRYFFLSYARLPPVPPVRGADLADPPDEWVRELFADLSAAVGRQAAAGPVPGPGFLGTADSTGRHWRSGIAEALGSVEVFVPLLSPDYYRRSWPRKEWSGFLQRLRDARVPDPMRRFTPVLWEPLSAGAAAPELAAALSLADDASLEPYALYGLAALLRQTAYRGCYEQVVGELATRVVAIAEKAPLGPSAVRLDEAAALSAGIGGKVFAVFISGGKGNPGMAASLADYACLMAERLGYAVLVADFGHGASQVGPHPGVFLVDKGTVGGNAAVADLDAKIAGLPPWVLPVVVTDWSAAAPPAGASEISLERSHYAYKDRPEIVHRGLDGVGSLQEFVKHMPFLITHAEREYLRLGPIQRAAPRPSSRPGLVDIGWPAVLPVKENPHD